MSRVCVTPFPGAIDLSFATSADLSGNGKQNRLSNWLFSDQVYLYPFPLVWLGRPCKSKRCINDNLQKWKPIVPVTVRGVT
jgi:hypothetical protein